MATRRTRRTRVTLRCVREDLELGIPPVEVDLGALDHPLVAEARRIAPAAPRGQKRILAIEHPLVYRLRHGRWRGATWLETVEGRFWLCAGAQRAAGSAEDAYEHSSLSTPPVGSCPMTTTVCATRSSATLGSSTLLPQRSRKRSAM